MKVSDIVKNMSFLADMQIDDDYFASGADVEVANSDGKVKFALRCIEMAAQEIALNVFPVIESQVVFAEGGRVDLSQTECDPIEILSAKDEVGRQVSFRYDGEAILQVEKSGNVLLTYKKKVGSVHFGDELNFACPKLDARTVAYGALAEYFLAKGDYSGHAVWDERFRDALALAKGAPKNMPKRRWA